MSNKFDIIHILKRELDTLQISDHDRRRLEEKFRLEFSYNSNHLEGNTITYLDTKALLLKDIVANSYTFRELEEMKAHDGAFTLIKEWAVDQDRDISQVNIKELNKLILVKDFWKDAQTPDGLPVRRIIKVGEYKEMPNSVQLANGEIFHYAEPFEVPAKMQELMDWYNDEKTGLHPVTLAAIFHHKFVLIHPFDDGNGRLSRLMMNYILIRFGYPPVVIKSVDKSKYLNVLRLADAGNFEAFIDFIVVQVIWSLGLSIKAAKGESIEEPNDWEKELSILSKSEDTIPERKTWYNLNTRVLDSCFPLFRKIKEKAENLLSQLFEEAYFILEIDNKTLRYDDVSNFDLNEFGKNLNDTQLLNFTPSLLRFKKNGTTIFDITIGINIQFQNYQYEISIDANKELKLTKFFNEKLSHQEIESFVNEWGKLVVEEIKHNISKK
ncbi:MAG: Fic family protein [Saprospiraceae bacterium]|nr:Fic family protein [Saprospiraceae bacterium]MBP8213676.1 Fic family protein [Saprospiraceae bacterium]